MSKRILLAVWLGAVIIIIGGCASIKPAQIVQPGDIVTVEYTCRLSDGTLVATTSESMAHSDTEKKSPIYRDVKVFGPVSLKVIAAAVDGGQGDPAESSSIEQGELNDVEPFSKAIERRLAQQISGLPVGTRTALVLTAETNNALSHHKQYLSQSQVRVRKKITNKSYKKYVEMTGAVPVVGDTYEYDKVFIATCTAVDEAADTITIEIRPKSGAVYTTDFGTADIVDGGNNYYLIFDVRKGKLVRNGDWVGLVSKADERRFVVDWGHPFGGEKLYCDVKILKSKKN